MVKYEVGLMGGPGSGKRIEVAPNGPPYRVPFVRAVRWVEDPDPLTEPLESWVTYKPDPKRPDCYWYPVENEAWRAWCEERRKARRLSPDPIIRELQRWLDENYREPDPTGET